MKTFLFAVAAAAALLANVASASELDTSVIDGVVRGKMDDFRACYEEGLKRKPRLAGKLVAKFKVERDGSVHEAGLTKSTLRDQQVESCLVGVFETMEFPAFGHPCADDEGSGESPGRDCSVNVTYPLHFAPDH